MAVDFICKNPAELLALFKDRIDQEEPKEKITTWEYDSDGDFTHKADQWRERAWLRPKIKDDRLTFNTINPKGKQIDRVVYGYYHGHITETFLNHFDKKFTSAHSSALATSEDRVAPRAQG